MDKFSRWLSPVVALFLATAITASGATTIGTDVTTGGNLTVTGTAEVTGNTTLTTLTASTTAAGSDISLKAADDIFLTTHSQVFVELFEPAYFQMYSWNGGDTFTYAPASENLNIYMDDDGTSNDFEINCDADSASCDISTNGDGGFVQFTTSGANSAINLAASGAGSGVTLSATNGSVKSSNPFGIPAAATLPTCDATIAPAGYYALYFDTTGPDLCFCNGSAWATVDGVGTCS